MDRRPGLLGHFALKVIYISLSYYKNNSWLTRNVWNVQKITLIPYLNITHVNIVVHAFQIFLFFLLNSNALVWKILSMRDNKSVKLRDLEASVPLLRLWHPCPFGSMSLRTSLCLPNNDNKNHFPWSGWPTKACHDLKTSSALPREFDNWNIRVFLINKTKLQNPLLIICASHHGNRYKQFLQPLQGYKRDLIL